MADPSELVPLGVAQLVVTVDGDRLVPPSQSTSYAARAKAAGDSVELMVLPGDDHFDHLDPSSAAWTAAADWLGRLAPHA